MVQTMFVWNRDMLRACIQSDRLIQNGQWSFWLTLLIVSFVHWLLSKLYSDVCRTTYISLRCHRHQLHRQHRLLSLGRQGTLMAIITCRPTFCHLVGLSVASFVTCTCRDWDIVKQWKMKRRNEGLCHNGRYWKWTKGHVNLVELTHASHKLQKRTGTWVWENNLSPELNWLLAGLEVKFEDAFGGCVDWRLTCSRKIVLYAIVHHAIKTSYC